MGRTCQTAFAQRNVRAKWSLFKTTQWGRIIQASQGNAPEALAELCQAYREPVYSYLRSRGFGHEVAEDLTQGLFASLLAPGKLAQADPGRGRFRDWLRKAAENHSCNHLDHTRALKRGGREEHLSIGPDIHEESIREASREPASPDRIFDRYWANTVIARALTRLRDDYVSEGKGDLFDHTEGILSQEGPCATDAEFAQIAKKTTIAIRVARHRLKEDMQPRFRRYLREEIGLTVEGPDAIDDELRILIDATT